MSETAVLPIPWIGHLTGFHGIGIDIPEYLHELQQSMDDPGEKAGTPDMSGAVIAPVVCHGKYTHDPSHDRGKTYASCWLNDEVEMVSHDAEVFYPESVL